MRPLPQCDECGSTNCRLISVPTPISDGIEIECCECGHSWPDDAKEVDPDWFEIQRENYNWNYRDE